MSTDYYKFIFQESPLGILLADTQGYILELNKQLIKTIGVASESLAKEINLLTSPLFIELGISELVKDCIEGKKLVKEVTYNSRQGKCIVLRASLTPLYKKSSVCYIIISLEDITECDKLKTDVYKKNQILQHVINNIPYQVWMKDTLGKYVFINKQYEELVDLKSQDVIGKTDREVYGSNFPDLIQSIEDHDKLSLDGPICYDEIIKLSPNQSLYLRKIKTPIFDKRGQLLGVVGVASDQTQEFYKRELIQEYIDKIKELMRSNQFIR